MFSKVDVEKEIKETREVYALVVVEENEEKVETPFQMKPLIQEFEDVIPDEILPGLPPMRNT